jgi:hypothetical protein
MLHRRRRFFRNSPALYSPSVILISGVTSVHMDDTPHFPVGAKVCAFHHRTSTICCMSPATRKPKQGFFAMARYLLGRIGWSSSRPTVSEHSLPQVNGERTDVPQRDSKGGNEGQDGITVTYDIWRTVEETTAVRDKKDAVEAEREM